MPVNGFKFALAATFATALPATAEPRELELLPRSSLQSKKYRKDFYHNELLLYDLNRLKLSADAVM